MIRQVAWLLLALLAGCASETPPAPTAADGNTQRAFESAIAGRLIDDINNQLDSVPDTKRAPWLRDRLQQFDQSVDLSMVTDRVKWEHTLLLSLAQSAAAMQGDGDYGTLVGQLSSLDWTLEQFDRRLADEINRIDRALAALARDQGVDPYEAHEYTSSLRKGARYPHDSYEGRQQYLDALSETMIDMQADWHDVLLRYEPSTLGINGIEATRRTFFVKDGELSINLAEVRDLPLFELSAVAVFFGYPGMQSLANPSGDSLARHLRLPGYSLGWAGYILDYIAAKDGEDVMGYLYFSRLMASLARADLMIHTGRWSMDEAGTALVRATPYSERRIRQMLNNVTESPGYYLAGTAGKLRIRELAAWCDDRGPGCDASFHQQVVDTGPVPFALLETRLAETSPPGGGR